MEQTLTTSLLDNKLALKGLFGTATDFYTKDITLMGYPACICMFEGLSSIERLWIMMLDVLSKPDVQPETPEELFDYILKQTAIPLESKSVVCVEDARAQLTAGTSVILIDGVARGLVLSTQSMQFRSVQEPSGEGNVRGSREGFTEPLRVNISLMRRLIRSGELMVETMTVGEHTKTEIALLYNTQLVPKQMLSTVKRRLESVKLRWHYKGADRCHCGHDDHRRAHNACADGSIPYDERRHKAYRMADGLGQTQPCLPHDLQQKIDKQCFHKQRQRRGKLRRRNFVQQFRRQQLRREIRNGHEYARQHHRDEERRVFQNADKRCKVCFFGIVVHALKILIEKIRHDHSERASIRHDNDFPLADFCAGSIRPFRVSYRLKK